MSEIELKPCPVAKDSARRLIRELRDYAKDKYTPGEMTHALTAAADTIDMLMDWAKARPTPEGAVEKMRATIRDCFLEMVAGGAFEEDIDADADDEGRLIDCTTYHLRGVQPMAFQEFCDALGIKTKHMETLGQAIERYVSEDSQPALSLSGSPKTSPCLPESEQP